MAKNKKENENNKDDYTNLDEEIQMTESEINK